MYLNNIYFFGELIWYDCILFKYLIDLTDLDVGLNDDKALNKESNQLTDILNNSLLIMEVQGNY